jgi:hypothetical protein
MKNMNIPTATSILRQLHKLGKMATHPDPEVAKGALQKLNAVANGTYITVAGDEAVAKAQTILASIG